MLKTRSDPTAAADAAVAPAVAPPALRKDTRRAVFRSYLGAVELADIMRSEQIPGARMLDIGGAYGIHARFFRRNVPDVSVEVLDTVPTAEPLIFTGSYMDYTPAVPYDYIWVSHVVEHLRNPGDFFDKLFADLKPGGWAAITVPPLKEDVTFAHVTLWNAGLLLVHLIHAGFDCNEARVATYGYNVTVLVSKVARDGRPKGKSLPPAIVRKGVYYEGKIERIAWKNDVPPIQPYEPLRTLDAMAENLSATDPSGFYALTGKWPLGYWDSEKEMLLIAG